MASLNINSEGAGNCILRPNNQDQAELQRITDYVKI